MINNDYWAPIQLFRLSLITANHVQSLVITNQLFPLVSGSTAQMEFSNIRVCE